jgi:hypothetical protein
MSPMHVQQEGSIKARPFRKSVVVKTMICSIKLTRLQARLLVYFSERRVDPAAELRPALTFGMISRSEFARLTEGGMYVCFYRSQVIRDLYGVERFEMTRDRYGRTRDSSVRYAAWRKRYRSAVIAVSAAIKRLRAQGLISDRWLFDLTEKGREVAFAFKSDLKAVSA